MAIPVVTRRTPRWLVWHGRLSLALLAALLVFAAVVPAVGARSASLSDLRAAIEAGRVDQVSVTGALPPGATGSSTAHLLWQDGLIARVTTVLHLSDGWHATPPRLADLDHLVGDMGHELSVGGKHVSLRAVTRVQGPGDSTSLAGWHLPLWMSPVGGVLWVVAVLLLATGPEPRWATRWAWFWAFITPLGVVALPLFALGSVPLPGRPAPRPPGHRLTGGWAFLLVNVSVAFFDLNS